MAPCLDVHQVRLLIHIARMENFQTYSVKPIKTALNQSMFSYAMLINIHVLIHD